MRTRLLEFLKAENKSSAQFAEEIGVQASGISHILSGRNNPSLDFVLKMLEKYKYLSSDWLLFGKGQMYKSGLAQSLFDENLSLNSERVTEIPDPSFTDNSGNFQEIISSKSVADSGLKPVQGRPKVIKIVWFFDNNSFEEYLPGK